MEKLKLKNHPYCNCYVELDNIENPTEIIFISYKTLVIYATKKDNVWHIECSGTYSQTTRKQISWFLREYFPGLFYQDVKSIAGKKMHIQYIDENNPIKFFNFPSETL